MRKLVVLIVGFGLATAACASSGGKASGGSDPSSTTAAAPAVVRAARSAGCGSSAVATGSTKQTLTAGAAERWYWLDVPPAHDGTTPLPLVMDFHGYSEGADVHVAMSGLAKYGETAGYVTVTPQGLGAVPMWDTTLGGSDLKFVGQLMDTVERQLCIDTNRVYATGLSNGAFLSSAIACEYSDRVAAVAPVAGASIIDGCTAKRPVPIVAFHGTDDGFVSYTGGLGEKALDLPAPDGSGRKLRDTVTADEIQQGAGGRKSIPDVMAAWAKRNGCPAGHHERTITDDVTELIWNCPPAAAVELYRVTGGGHTWPGSEVSQSLANIMGPTTMSVSADEVMWKFFVAHPLTRA